MKKHLLTLLMPVLLLLSCSKNDDKPKTSIDQDKVSLNYDQTHQFELRTGGTKLDNVKVNWSSSDQLVGTINSAGLFSAKRIGTTTIKATANGESFTSEITVVPYSQLCVEPVIEFGTSLTNVKAKEKRVLLAQNTAELVYKGENAKVQNIFYIFNNGGLESSALILSPTSAVVEETVKFFSERYEFVGEFEEVFYFQDSKTTIGLGFSDGVGFLAVYFPAEMTGSSAKASKNEKLRVLKQAFITRKQQVTLTP